MTATRETERVVLAAIRSLGAGFVEASPDEVAAVAASANMTLAPIRAWRSRHFVAQLFDEPGGRRLSIQRTGANCYIRPGRRDQRPISWEELQAVKAALGFGDVWAVEIYPPTTHAVNVADMRHLWLIPEPGYGWKVSR